MNIRLWGQVILQVAGLIYATVKYRNEDIQSVDNYVPKVEYDLPFDGEWYVINGGITENTSHSWEVLPQRYAYDFAIVDEAGESCSGDIKDVRNYYCYGKDILAPADGIIVSLKNNFPDCKIMGNGQTDPDTPDIGGNRIIIKHASNEYSAICHLMYGSVIVKKGQVVKRGEVIAKCGNSGNTSEPHVHFQIQNSAYFYACIGKPILLTNIQKRVYAKYDMVDTRPFPEEPIKVGYIYRGLLVKNLGKKEV